jgi:hypothetical protein
MLLAGLAAGFVLGKIFLRPRRNTSASPSGTGPGPAHAGSACVAPRPTGT